MIIEMISADVCKNNNNNNNKYKKEIKKIVFL